MNNIVKTIESKGTDSTRNIRDEIKVDFERLTRLFPKEPLSKHKKFWETVSLGYKTVIVFVNHTLYYYRSWQRTYYNTNIGI